MTGTTKETLKTSPSESSSARKSPFWFWPKLAIRELTNNRRFSLFFIFNLALGLAGFIALDSFKESLDVHLGKNSKAILGADLAIHSSYPFDEANLRKLESVLPEPFSVTRKTTLFTMVAGGNQSRLVEVNGIEEQFPFYGQVLLQENGKVSAEQINQNLIQQKKVWAYPELMSLLNLDLGANIKIGNLDFQLSDTVLDDPSSSFSSFGLAPKVYLGYSQLEETGLMTQKSRVRFQRLYQLPKGTDLNLLVQKIKLILPTLTGNDQKIRVVTHKRAGDNLGRLMGYLNDYLGLIALIALFLAGIGAAYLFRNYLVHRFREMAILMSLGANRKQTYRLVLWQLGILGTVSAILAILLSLAILPLLPMMLKLFLPKGFVTLVNPSSLWLALVLGAVGSLVFCLPVLQRIRAVQPLQLFHESVAQPHHKFVWTSVFSYLPLFVLFWGLAIWQSNSIIVGSAFVFLLLASIVILGGLSWVILVIAGKLSRSAKNTNWRLAFRNLQRNRSSAVSCFLALALGTLLINLIPQIYRGLQEEVTRPEGYKIPSLFLFDIQPEQVDELKQKINAENIRMNYLSPMVRARLEKVNGDSFENQDEENAATREEQRAEGFRRRTLNLSYRTSLSDSEQIVAGKELASTYDWDAGVPAEVSLEERFAARIGLKLGDVLTFNVQEVPIEAVVTNLRRVKWNSFQPNFFILFQPGVLEHAPASFLASIGGLNAERRLQVQNRIVQHFPNVSVIDVTRMVSRVLSISDQMVLALKLMAYLSILAGLVVVFSIARHEVDGRLWELNMLKVLGAGFKDIQMMVQVEFAVLGFFASLFGVLISLAMSYGLAWWFFESLWKMTWEISFMSVIGVTGLSVGVAWLATRKALKTSPLSLLRSY